MRLMKLKNFGKNQKGFTLIELALVVLILGITTVLMGSTLQRLALINAKSKAQNDLITNQKIAYSMLQWAEYGDTTMSLPTPYNGTCSAGICYGGVNAITSSSGDYQDLYTYLTAQNIRPAVFNASDSIANPYARIYQTAPGQTLDVPINDTNGEVVTLTYDVGVLYQSTCLYSSGAACFTASGATWTGANFNTWTAPTTATGVYSFSTLPLQKKKLQQLNTIIETIRRAHRSYVASNSRPATPMSTCRGSALATSLKRPSVINYCIGTSTNPSSVSKLEVGSASVCPICTTAALRASYATNHSGCYDGWYSLGSAANVYILQELGLSQAEFGWTPWGGSIMYCSDYAPYPSAKDKDTAPYNAALMIMKDTANATSGGAPLTPPSANGTYNSASDLIIPLN